MGSLQQIHYPTGGHTTFIYEAPKAAYVGTKKVNLAVYENDLNAPAPDYSVNKSYQSFYIGGGYGGTKGTEASFIGAQQIRGTLNVFREDVRKGGGVATLKITNLSTGYITTTTLSPPIGQQGSGTNFMYDIHAGGTYKVELSCSANSNVNSVFRASVSFDISDYKYKDAAGIRISKVLDYTANNTTPLVKRYYYTRATNVLNGKIGSEDSAVTTYTPVNYSTEWRHIPCCPSSTGTNVYSFASLNSNPFGYLFANADNQVAYKYVTTSFGGDNFENGGVEKEFRVVKSDKPTVGYFNQSIFHHSVTEDQLYFGSMTDNKSILNGVLLQQIDYKKSSNDLLKIGQKNYNYAINTIGETSGLLLTTHSTSCLNPETLIQPSIAYYKNFTYDVDLTRIDSKSFTTSLDERSNPVMVEFLASQQFFEYGTLQGMPTKVTTSKSDGSSTIVTNKYLSAANITSLSTGVNAITASEATAYTNLINQGRISGPIQTAYYTQEVGGTAELKSTQRFTYDVFSGLTLPKRTKSSKMNLALEENSIVHRYDTAGYPVESSVKDGIHTSVIYGYKDKKIIAKLVNLRYSTIPTATINSLQLKAGNVTSTSSMNVLEAALDQLRITYPKAQITTYVYNKLGQLSSMKDIRGTKISYEYDDCYRLIRVRDRLGNLLKENQYNIINNNN